MHRRVVEPLDAVPIDRNFNKILNCTNGSAHLMGKDDITTRFGTPGQAFARH